MALKSINDIRLSLANINPGSTLGRTTAGVGQVEQLPAPVNLDGAKAVNTTYTNSSTTRPLLVMVTFRSVITLAAGNAFTQAKSDTATPPITAVSGIVGIQAGLLNEDNTFQICFMVEAGKNYRVDSSATNGTVTVGKWFEVQL